MATRILAKRPQETHWEYRSRIIRLEQEARDKSQPVVPIEAMANGDYKPEFVVNHETNTKAYVLVNRGGTPLCRWRAGGQLSITQDAAIKLCEYLWRTISRPLKLTADYGERIPGNGNTETRSNAEIDARADMKRIEGYFPGPLKAYFAVFENICRYDMPAGVAGSTLSRSSRTADARAHQVVCLVSDIIAQKEGL